MGATLERLTDNIIVAILPMNVLRILNLFVINILVRHDSIVVELIYLCMSGDGHWPTVLTKIRCRRCTVFLSRV